ncbi:hypothetical protein HDV63DRAFT_372067, partial [Trichoderma sp. SZMC 28014]
MSFVMTRSDDTEASLYAAYNIAREIPRGKITSYGHNARLRDARISCDPYHHM